MKHDGQTSLQPSHLNCTTFNQSCKINLKKVEYNKWMILIKWCVEFFFPPTFNISPGYSWTAGLVGMQQLTQRLLLLQRRPEMLILVRSLRLKQMQCNNNVSGLGSYRVSTKMLVLRLNLVFRLCIDGKKIGSLMNKWNWI